MNDEIRKKAAEAVKAMQDHAKKHGFDRLTDAEIQQEIDEARASHRKPDPEPPHAPDYTATVKPGESIQETLDKAPRFVRNLTINLSGHVDCDCLSCRLWTS